MKKVTCNDTECLYNDMNGGCRTKIEIGNNAKCMSFKKGFVYYFGIVWDALSSKNYIDEIEMSSDMRLGLYYVMECYDLGFSVMDWGSCRLYMLKDGEGGEALDSDKIIQRGMVKGKLEEHYKNFCKGKLPDAFVAEMRRGQEERKGIKGGREKADLDFGWLSPTGDFTESPFGSHEVSAEGICKAKGWENEKKEWSLEDKRYCLYRDFLLLVKGYCLIHNPAGMGGYIVQHHKTLTKKQRDFLYAYFMDKGDRVKAGMYMEE